MQLIFSLAWCVQTREGRSRTWDVNGTSAS